MNKSRHRQALGRRAEAAVADYLVARGFSILGQNVRVGHLEIDLIARRDALIVIVEVRTRTDRSFQTPLESLSRTKEARIRRALEILWQEKFVHDATIERVRIDVAAVSFEGTEARVEYVESAFDG